MIDELDVRNLGVLAHARIEPGEGLTVVTGETGTGKTILLGALRLLLGEPARADLVGPFGDEAVVEGRFLLPDAELVVGRRLLREGRSKAYLDGSMASAAALESATSGLVEIVGQHDQLTLTRPAEVRELVDRLLDRRGEESRLRYRRLYDEWTAVRDEQRALGGGRTAIEREIEVLAFQSREIAAVGPRAGEDAELSERLVRLRNADRLAELLGTAARAVDDSRDALGIASGALRRTAEIDPSAAVHARAAGILEGDLGELAAGVAASLESLEADPDELEAAERRLHALTDLLRKYGPSLDDVVAFAGDAERRVAELTGLLERADGLADRADAAWDAVVAAGAALRAGRESAGGRLASEARRHLLELGFVRPFLAVDVAAADPGPAGADVVRLRFASDDRLPPGDVSRVASGGELSRLVLSLRLAGGTPESATVAFDEVDSGVGGATALALGRKLSELARRRQVICVTHLPQVAAFADTHYVVSRDGTVAGVARVEGSERVAELARMLAGLPDSERGREAAEELMALARDR